MQAEQAASAVEVMNKASMRPSLLAPILLTVIALGVALLVFRTAPAAPAAAPPGEGSAEAGFARDMATHHAQAVELATLLRDRTEDEELRILALDIMLTQQAQIGQMQGWLALWSLPNVSLEPAMTWMGMPTTERMPGMASAAEVNRMRSLQGAEAEELFLHLLIPHHRGGVAMAQAVLERSQNPAVRALATAIVNAQQIEIDYMQDLLQRKGFPPVPDTPVMNHDR